MAGAKCQERGRLSSRMESGVGMSNEGPETERLLAFGADARHEDHLIFRPINLDLSSNYK